ANVTPSASASSPSQSSSSPSQSALQPVSSSPIRSLAELEKQMALEAQRAAAALQPTPLQQATLRAKRFTRQILGVSLLLGIPVGIIAVINLPYAPIRKPVAEKAPILLLPSYISMDQHFRRAIESLEAAKQLIDQATAPADLELGEQKLQQAQESLDRLPTWLWSELPDTQAWWWYSWRLRYSSFTNAQTEAGRLQGKVFQEKNALTALEQAQQSLQAAQQQYRQAKTSIEQQTALAAWQTALDRLQQVPESTLAHQLARQSYDAGRRDLEAIGGLAVSNQRAATLIAAAKQFGWQAAQAGQNAPHTATEWAEVIRLWQAAIDQLQQVPQTDLTGYAEAQKLLAIYKVDQGRIRVRLEQEQQAVATLEQVKAQINRLIARTPDDPQRMNRNATVGELQQIIHQLETIASGTTAYPEAQKLLVSAKNKLKQFQ
ncbi:MAG: hypothetical protein IGS38_07805, partial [Synechococcales cyanobacterium M58_A2018_015]|nr:hypothetical protein [Synechococcales cyanobacterium M58_A2018_015]